MASIESRMNVFHLLSQTLVNGVHGDVVEIGCHAGESSVVLQSVIQGIDPSRELHVFDSFQGVPPGNAADEGVYKAGDMAVSEKQLYENFDSLGLKRPIVHVGWFEETLPGSLPEQIAFALLDADLYQSTLLGLRAAYPRLTSNAICLLGVYWDPQVGGVTTTDMKYKSPGVKRACEEFFVDKSERISILLAGNYTSSYFRKI
jgi:O-methyltransferase